MKKSIPLVISFVVGVFMVVEHFSPHPLVQDQAKRFTQWGIIIGAFTYIFALTNLVVSNLGKVVRREQDWGYKVVLLLGMLVMLVVGFGWGGAGAGKPAYWLYHNIYRPLSASMFALLAFFIASAAFRAFRARNLEAGLLLGAALLVMAGRVPLGELLSSHTPDLMTWIMTVPNNAGKKAILIGAALGAISTGLRVILGLERGHLSG